MGAGEWLRAGVLAAQQQCCVDRAYICRVYGMYAVRLESCCICSCWLHSAHKWHCLYYRSCLSAFNKPLSCLDCLVSRPRSLKGLTGRQCWVHDHEVPLSAHAVHACTTASNKHEHPDQVKCAWMRGPAGGAGSDDEEDEAGRVYVPPLLQRMISEDAKMALEVSRWPFTWYKRSGQWPAGMLHGRPPAVSLLCVH